MKLPISNIQIKPNRIRRVFDQKKLDELAESLRTVGLIQPIVIDEQNFLLAGERRLRAARLLGWTEVSVVHIDDLDDQAKEVVELEENIRREDLTYVEEVLALQRIHELHQVKYGKTSTGGGRGHTEGWKVKDTAELLGISVGATSQDLQLARAIEKDPELAQQKTKIAAKSMLGRKQAIKARQILAVLKGVSGDKSAQPEDQTEIRMLYGDARQIVPTLQDDSISCLLTDPPWQVEFDEKFGSDKHTGLAITQQVLALAYPKLQEGSLCWMFCATKHLMRGTIFNIVQSCGYRIYDQVLIWYKPHVAHSSHPYRELKNDYEPAFFFSKGEPRDLLKPMFAVWLEVMQGRKLHNAQKPLGLLKFLIEQSTVKNEIVLDPFMGSGTTMQAAKLTGRRGVGIESIQDTYNLAKAELVLTK